MSTCFILFLLLRPFFAAMMPLGMVDSLSELGPKWFKNPTISTTIRVHLLSDEIKNKKQDVMLTDIWKAFRWWCCWSSKVPASCMSQIARRRGCHGMVLLKLGGSQWWPVCPLSSHKSNDHRLTLLWCFGSILGWWTLDQFGILWYWIQPPRCLPESLQRTASCLRKEVSSTRNSN